MDKKREEQIDRDIDEALKYHFIIEKAKQTHKLYYRSANELKLKNRLKRFFKDLRSLKSFRW